MGEERRGGEREGESYMTTRATYSSIGLIAAELQRVSCCKGSDRRCSQPCSCHAGGPPIIHDPNPLRQPFRGLHYSTLPPPLRIPEAGYLQQHNKNDLRRIFPVVVVCVYCCWLIFWAVCVCAGAQQLPLNYLPLGQSARGIASHPANSIENTHTQNNSKIEQDKQETHQKSRQEAKAPHSTGKAKSKSKRHRSVSSFSCRLPKFFHNKLFTFTRQPNRPC